MVKAIINIENSTNHLLNLIKAKYELKDKSEAINRMAAEYIENILEPSLKSSFISETKRIMKEKSIKVGNVDDLRKMIRSKNV